MGYANHDLDVFRLLRSKEQLNGTAYFELHPGELPEPFACWLDGSLFVRDAGFDFFVECFHGANPKWDYFSFESFDLAQVEALSADIGSFAAGLTPGCGREAVFARYNSLFKKDIWNDVDTDLLRGAALATASDLRAWLREVQLSGKVLWFLGM
jgi:hypothetical protein